MYRRFKFISGNDTFDLSKPYESFLVSPKGLGISYTASYGSPTDGFFQHTNRESEQRTVAGEIAFNTAANPYKMYRSLVEFIIKAGSDLRFGYAPDGEHFYYASCEVSKLEKTEIQRFGSLVCAIEIKLLSPWAELDARKEEISPSSNPLTYTYGYDLHSDFLRNIPVEAGETITFKQAGGTQIPINVRMVYGSTVSDELLYSRQIPEGVFSVSVDRIYGCCRIYNQWFNPSDYASFPYSANGVTLTKSGGTITVTVASGGATADTTYQFCDYRVDHTPDTTHRFLLLGGVSDNIYLYPNVSATAAYDYGDGGIFKTSAVNFRFRVTVKNGTPAGTYTVKPALVDLTQCFGTGLEPEAVNDIRIPDVKTYIAANAGYDTAGTVVSAKVTAVEITDSNNSVVDTIAIPADIQALTGYGQSYRSSENYTDYLTLKNYAYVSHDGSSWHIYDPPRIDDIMSVVGALYYYVYGTNATGTVDFVIEGDMDGAYELSIDGEIVEPVITLSTDNGTVTIGKIEIAGTIAAGERLEISTRPEDSFIRKRNKSTGEITDLTGYVSIENDAFARPKIGGNRLGIASSSEIVTAAEINCYSYFKGV